MARMIGVYKWHCTYCDAKNRKALGRESAMRSARRHANLHVHETEVLQRKRPLWLKRWALIVEY